MRFGFDPVVFDGTGVEVVFDAVGRWDALVEDVLGAVTLGGGMDWVQAPRASTAAVARITRTGVPTQQLVVLLAAGFFFAAAFRFAIADLAADFFLAGLAVTAWWISERILAKSGW